MTTTTVLAETPIGTPPAWAIMQRRLFDVMDEGWWLFRERYCLPDGSLRYAGPVQSRDGADDFYEAFVNWPVLYQLGGADDLIDVAKWHWEGVTRQLTDLGFLVDEFERGYDWFHLGESMIFFYALCAADPGDEAFRERAYRFAELYLPGSPAGNYDPATRTIRAPHNGGGGPRWGINDEWRDVRRGPDEHADLRAAAVRRTRHHDVGGPQGSGQRRPDGRGDDPPPGCRRHRRQPGRDHARPPTPGSTTTTTGSRRGRWSIWTPGRSGRRRTAVCCRTTSVRAVTSASSSTAAGTAASTAGTGRTACTASARPPVSLR